MSHNAPEPARSWENSTVMPMHYSSEDFHAQHNPSVYYKSPDNRLVCWECKLPSPDIAMMQCPACVAVYYHCSPHRPKVCKHCYSKIGPEKPFDDGVQNPPVPLHAFPSDRDYSHLKVKVKKEEYY